MVTGTPVLGPLARISSTASMLMPVISLYSPGLSRLSRPRSSATSRKRLTLSTTPASRRARPISTLLWPLLTVMVTSWPGGIAFFSRAALHWRAWNTTIPTTASSAPMTRTPRRRRRRRSRRSTRLIGAPPWKSCPTNQGTPSGFSGPLRPDPSGSRGGPPADVQPGLEEHAGRDLVDHLAAVATADPAADQGPLGGHGGEALVDQLEGQPGQ